jgi:hypothetical protein
MKLEEGQPLEAAALNKRPAKKPQASAAVDKIIVKGEISSAPLGSRTAHGVVAGAVMRGLITGCQELFDVYKDQKQLSEAVKNMGLAAAQGAKQGGAIGLLSSLVRQAGQKAALPVISSSTASTTIAAGMLDGGQALYAYSRGQIDEAELGRALQDTVVKSTVTIYFVKSFTLIAGGLGSVFLPIAAYTVSSYVLQAAKALLQESQLQKQEYEKMAALEEAARETMLNYYQTLNTELAHFRQDRREVMAGFLKDYDACLSESRDYQGALQAILGFTESMSYSLQHREFQEFQEQMQGEEEWVLK